MRYLTLILCLLCINILQGQVENDDKKMNDLPYYEIPEAPETYNACTVTARMLDGLGFRYYWATEGLRTQDLDYRPGPEARTSLETLGHIHGLVEMVLNSVNQVPNVRPAPDHNYSWDEMRASTLTMLKEASDKLRSSDPDALEDYKIIFKRGENETEFPFWNQLNGPIGDALWHTGQVVSFRRASGNPFNSKASVFSGKVRS